MCALRCELKVHEVLFWKWVFRNFSSPELSLIILRNSLVCLLNSHFFIFLRQFCLFWNICLPGVSHVMVISSTECFDKVGNISLNYEQTEKPSKEKGMEIMEINLWSHLFIQFLKNVNIKCNKCKRNCNFHFVWRSWKNSTEKTAFFHESLTGSLRSYGRVANFIPLKGAVCP